MPRTHGGRSEHGTPERNSHAQGRRRTTRRRLPGFLALHTEDAVMHIPGSGPLAGDHVGREGIAAVFQREAVDARRTTRKWCRWTTSAATITLRPVSSSGCNVADAPTRACSWSSRSSRWTTVGDLVPAPRIKRRSTRSSPTTACCDLPGHAAVRGLAATLARHTRCRGARLCRGEGGRAEGRASRDTPREGFHTSSSAPRGLIPMARCPMTIPSPSTSAGCDGGGRKTRAETAAHPPVLTP